MVKLGELMMILELHRQGLTVSAIARQLGMDRKTVRRYIARGLGPPAYGPRRRSRGAPIRFCRICASGSGPIRPQVVRLWRELRERGYAGGASRARLGRLGPTW